MLNSRVPGAPSSPRAEAGGLEDLFPGPGEMAALMRAKDWSSTPVGAPDAWPESLRIAVRICLTSSFPMWIWWGPEFTMFYNDAHRPMLGPAKHPQWLGRSAQGCWSEIWNDLVPMIDGVRQRRQASGFDDLLLILDRNGIKEETYFTFSISPILGEGGAVDGLFCPTTETTRKVVSERRLRTLQNLGARTVASKTAAEACAVAAEILQANPHDVPVALLYLSDPEGRTARLAGCVGLARGGPDAPELVDLGSGGGWPLQGAAAAGQARHVSGPRTSAPLPGGPWPEPCRDVLVLPLGTSGEGRVAGFLVAGASPRRVFDEDYRGFFELVAGQLATAVANANAYQAERARAESLAALDRSKTAFFSNVSHEFRTPLTLMLGPLEDELAEAAEPRLPPARRERLLAAHRNSLRLLKLVNSLLDFSRLEAGRLEAAYEPVDLAELTAGLAGVFRAAVERARLGLTVDCPPLPEPVYVDRGMWEKIVLNLLSNALKHTFEGEIRVELRRAGERVELAVTDSGVGIPAAELPRLFERFHRVQGAQSRSHEGSGIGLALVKELAGLHGGGVRVESREGRGSTFTVSVKTGRAHLPPERVGTARRGKPTSPGAAAFVEEALHWLPGPAEADPAEQTPAPAGPRARVLLADDNADMRDYVGRLLRERYEVVAVADGRAALDAVRQAPPDLVVSDVMMPVLDGFGLLKELRADPRTESLPVILLSARAGEEASVEGLEAGADDYVVKPFSARELLARVRTHLEVARLRRAWARELEQANQDLEAFSYSVSHDLRAPLRAIDGFSGMLAQDYGDTLDAEGRRRLGVVTKNARRMGVLIDDLLKFARLGRKALSARRFDPRVLVDEILEELEGAFAGRKIDFRIGALPAAWGDPSLLRQVFGNLLSNAIKYTRPREAAQVEVGGEAGARENTYWVKDNGVGFEPEYAHKLFSVFQRLHTSEQFEGTGVGLALVQKVVRRHGGDVRADGAVDQGAAFYFTLPHPGGSGNGAI